MTAFCFFKKFLFQNGGVFFLASAFPTAHAQKGMAARFIAKLVLCIFFILLLFSQFRLVESKKKPKVKITTEVVHYFY